MISKNINEPVTTPLQLPPVRVKYSKVHYQRHNLIRVITLPSERDGRRGKKKKKLKNIKKPLKRSNVTIRVRKKKRN